jgi:DtxR family transcriptional regulator, Mn-dependent transcriptional regulator
MANNEREIKMDIEKKISSNMEDYLEAIATLKKQMGVARVKDIGHLLNVKNPSVNAALNTLSTAGLVTHERYGYADLTPEGDVLARDVLARHDTLVKFFTMILGVDSQTAEVDACRMEHSMSREGFERMSKFIDFIKACPQNEKPGWLKNFDYYMKTGKRMRCSMRNKPQKKK